MKAIDWAKEEENPTIGHKIMVKKQEQVGKFEKFDSFGYNFMANGSRASREIWNSFGHNFVTSGRISMIYSLNDSCWCEESNEIIKFDPLLFCYSESLRRCNIFFSI